MMNYLLILLTVLVTSAQAETVWEYVDRKLEDKKTKRWSLSNWLFMKEKFALQDQWLALNTRNEAPPFEFYIDYSKLTFDSDTANNENEEETGVNVEAAIYYSIIGLSYRSETYEDLYTQQEGALNLRLIGTSHQSTHLILTAGGRVFEDEVEGEFRQTFYGGDIALYLLPFLGFDGRYRRYLNAENDDSTSEIESVRTQWGMFIDISFLRIFTFQFEENFDYKTLATGDKFEQQIKGTGLGVRLYF